MRTVSDPQPVAAWPPLLASHSPVPPHAAAAPTDPSDAGAGPRRVLSCGRGAVRPALRAVRVAAVRRAGRRAVPSEQAVNGEVASGVTRRGLQGQLLSWTNTCLPGNTSEALHACVPKTPFPPSPLPPASRPPRCCRPPSTQRPLERRARRAARTPTPPPTRRPPPARPRRGRRLQLPRTPRRRQRRSNRSGRGGLFGGRPMKPSPVPPAQPTLPLRESGSL